MFFVRVFNVRALCGRAAGCHGCVLGLTTGIYVHVLCTFSTLNRLHKRYTTFRTRNSEVIDASCGAHRNHRPVEQKEGLRTTRRADGLRTVHSDWLTLSTCERPTLVCTRDHARPIFEAACICKALQAAASETGACSTCMFMRYDTELWSCEFTTALRCDWNLCEVAPAFIVCRYSPGLACVIEGCAMFAKT